MEGRPMMRHDVPSATAHEAARHRAAHQVLELGELFSDPLAVRILGEDAAVIANAESQHPRRRDMRIFIAARSRFAEDALHVAVRHGGVRQLVVLGAGLDTFAYRNGYRGLRVFEVDRPATQSWKRERLANASIAVPASVTFVGIDFERESLGAGLSTAGFDSTLPTFFICMGVVVYLSEEAAWSILDEVAGMQARSWLVFDYSNPPTSLAARESRDLTAAAERMAAMGETWINFFDTQRLHQRLRAIGFTEIDDLGPTQIVARYMPDRAPPSNDLGPHLMCARKL
jgi:methyltransferase (TIGR00027 family)